MKPYLIRFWHGTPDADSFFMEKVKKICRKDEQNNFFWDHSLNEFEHAWRGMFLFMPANESDGVFISGRICITQHGSFGQR
jgi:hypothetical protein